MIWLWLLGAGRKVLGLPWKVKVGLVVALLFLAFLGWFHHQAIASCNKRWEDKILKERTAYYEEVDKLRKTQQVVITRTVIQYRDRVKVVKEKGDEIEKIVYIVRNDAPLSGGMRVLHDSAATGNVPNDPEGVARTAAPVEAATLAQTISDNYTTCRSEFAKLVALQSLVVELAGPSAPQKEKP